VLNDGIIVTVMLLLWLTVGTMETAHSHVIGFTAAKSLLDPMSCSDTSVHTQVCCLPLAV